MVIIMRDNIIRPSWEDYFMDMAELVSKRSTCIRRAIGAVIVKDNRLLTTGYNGAPINIEHCIDVGCLREELNVPSGERHELCRGIHAEQNAIIQAARYGIKINGSIMFCTNQPCSICSKMIINAGIKKVYYRDRYPDNIGEEMLIKAGVEVIQLKEVES